MNILITGGAGYIGSVTLRVLRDAGHSISVLDNLSFGHRDSVPDDIPFFQGNIDQFEQVIPMEQEIDAVVHLGALISAGESMTDARRYWENNVLQTSTLLEALRKRNIKKLVFASTAAVYGNPTKTPITENSPTNPTNIYGATKLAMDNAISIEAETHGLAATSLRFFNVAGAYNGVGERHVIETHLIPLALAACNGDRPALPLFGTDYPTKDGTCVRDYIHVADLAEAILKALDALKPRQHTIYNLGNGAGFTNREVLATIEEVTGHAVPVVEQPRRSGDPAVLIASSTKAANELDWHPSRPNLREIISDAWQFYTTLSEKTPTQQ